MPPEIVRNELVQAAGFQPRTHSDVQLEERSEIEKAKESSSVQRDESTIVCEGEEGRELDLPTQVYGIAGNTHSLIGTSEIPLVGMHAETIIPNEQVGEKGQELWKSMITLIFRLSKSIWLEISHVFLCPRSLSFCHHSASTPHRCFHALLPS